MTPRFFYSLIAARTKVITTRSPRRRRFARYVVVALLWLIPDRRIEQKLSEEAGGDS